MYRPAGPTPPYVAPPRRAAPLVPSRGSSLPTAPAGYARRPLWPPDPLYVAVTDPPALRVYSTPVYGPRDPGARPSDPYVDSAAVYNPVGGLGASPHLRSPPCCGDVLAAHPHALPTDPRLSPPGLATSNAFSRLDTRLDKMQDAFFTLLDAVQSLKEDRTPPPGLSVPAAPLHTAVPACSVPPRPARPQAVPPSPLPHDASLKTFKLWRDQWGDYSLVANIPALAPAAQMAALRSTVAPETRSLLQHALGVQPHGPASVDQAIDALHSYFGAKLNTATRMSRFSAAKQEAGEPFDAFLVRLKQLAADTDLCHCDCGSSSTRCADWLLRNQISMGVYEAYLRQQLLALPDSTPLGDVVAMCRARETALASDPSTPSTTHNTSAYRKAQRPSGPSPAPSSTSPGPPSPATPAPAPSPAMCLFCDTVHIRGPSHCPNWGRRCETCGRRGHMSPQCVAVLKKFPPRPRSGPRSAATSARSSSPPPGSAATPPRPTSPPLQTSIYEPSSSALAASLGACPPAPRVRVCVSAHKSTYVSCIPDTGSDVTLLDVKLLHLLGLRRVDLAPPPGPVYQPDGSPLTTMVGTSVLTITMGHRTTSSTVYFLHGLSSNLLSWTVCRALRIVPKAFPEQISPSVAGVEIAAQRHLATPASPLPPVATSPNGHNYTHHPPLPASSGKSPRISTSHAPPAPGPPSPASGPPTHPTTQPVPPGPAPQPPIASSPARATSWIPTPPDLPVDSSPAVAKAWFLRRFHDVLISKSQFLEGVHLPTMSGPPMRIHLRQDACPFSISTPRQVPLALQEGAKSELEALLRQGIIVPAGDSPSAWCHPMVVVPKPKGGVRITVDLSKLNDQVLRPTHPSPTPFEAIRAIPAGTRFFTTLDALCGYWQLPLQEDDSHLTTFITPLGRFRYTRGPMGFSATGDEFCRRGDIALAGIPHCQKVVDDIVLWDSTYQHHIARIFQVLARCRAHGITINADKFVVALPDATFCGFRLSRAGVAADPNKVRAIAEFPVPVNITDVRSFMGLTNQLAGFSSEIAAAAVPLRPLLRPAYKFMWTPDHQLAFDTVKKALASTPILQFFDPSRPTLLQTDASRLNGLGYALLQKDESDVWRLIQCGSRFLADAESRYSTIELELLAVTWSMWKCSYFLMGISFGLVTDHRPLLPILDKFTLDQIANPRLQRLREKIAAFTFRTSWLKGSALCLPDALSRAPVSRPTADDIALCQDLSASVRAVSSSLPAALPSPTGPQDLHLDHLRREASLDDTYGALLTLIMSGFPTNKTALPSELLPFWRHRDDLSADDGLVLLGSRILVPKSRRRDVLSRLHAAHRGTDSTIRRARSTVWWPAIESDIRSTVLACEPCQSHLPRQQKEPLLQTPPSSRPFEDVSADFCQIGSHHWLVFHDRYSGWLEAVHFGHETPASRTVSVVSQLFAQLGVPLSIRTDNGPQFASSAFREFLSRWGVRHDTSSPHYPQSNGHAEAGVKKFKLTAVKVAPSGQPSEALSRALLELRNMPSFHGLSPAQLAWGRPLRTCVPVHPSALAPTPSRAVDASVALKATRQDQQRAVYDASAAPLPSLYVEDAVRLLDPVSQRWDVKARILDLSGSNRSVFVVRSDTGARFWRNRKHVRLDTSAPPSPSGGPTTSAPSPPAPAGASFPAPSARTRVQPHRAAKH